MYEIILAGTAILVVLLVLGGFKSIRPTERVLIERFGKYHSFASPGLNWLIPLVDNLIVVNVTEKLMNAGHQEIITKDKLNAVVDAQVYFKIKSDEENVKSSQYNVNNCEDQIVNLARTTLRNIIGTLSLTEANSDRDKINKSLMETLTKETKAWGIEVVRTELKEINPPASVQETMNKVVIAENEKTAATDFATAIETKADGERRASIKRAEGLRQAAILEAEGKSKAFELVNKNFKGPSVQLKKLEVTQASLEHNSKVILTTTGITPQIILGELTK